MSRLNNVRFCTFSSLLFRHLLSLFPFLLTHTHTAIVLPFFQFVRFLFMIVSLSLFARWFFSSLVGSIDAAVDFLFIVYSLYSSLKNILHTVPFMCRCIMALKLDSDRKIFAFFSLCVTEFYCYFVNIRRWNGIGLVVSRFVSCSMI